MRGSSPGDSGFNLSQLDASFGNLKFFRISNFLLSYPQSKSCEPFNALSHLGPLSISLNSLFTFRYLKKASDRHGQHVRKFLDVVRCGIGCATLDLAYICSMKSCHFSQLFLRKTHFYSDFSDVDCEQCSRLRCFRPFIHVGRVPKYRL